jgi:flagellar biosynthesis protein FlhF
MEKIKADLGPDAIVLSSKRLKNGKNPLLEVVAGRDEAETGIKVGKMPEADRFDLLRTEIDQLKNLIIDRRAERDFRSEISGLQETLNHLFDVIGLKKNKGMAPCLSKVYYYLISIGISKQNASALIEALKLNCPPSVLESYPQTLIAAEAMLKNTITPSYQDTTVKRVSAFIGPAGEGKTTTLAKRAADCMFGGKSSVGIISMDTYRIGATEQLKTYADIMELPMEIVSGKKAFKKAIDRFADRDVILVDTPGKSRNDAEYLLELKNLFNSGLPVETNLVLSMTSSLENLIDTAIKFNITNYHNMIFTKLDDSRNYGSIYNVIKQVGKPVSYIANGQNVPRDLLKLDPAGLARMIVENRVN